jgi:8-oxo-dGTP pyrophosphatase MutT (NUDIX family)
MNLPPIQQPPDLQNIDAIAQALRKLPPDNRPSVPTNRHAAVAMVLRKGSQNALEALFIQRAKHPKDPWSGQMAFPGGRQEPGEHDLAAVARRETLEEVGLGLERAPCLGKLHSINGGRLRVQALTVTPYVYFVECPGPLTHNYEVADTVWVPVTYLADQSNVQDYYWPNDQIKRAFPSIQYQGYTIWGLTYRMIANFMTAFGIELPGEPLVTKSE